jgi:hypothetical protein
LPGDLFSWQSQSGKFSTEQHGAITKRHENQWNTIEDHDANPQN